MTDKFYTKNTDIKKYLRKQSPDAKLRRLFKFNIKVLFENFNFCLIKK